MKKLRLLALGTIFWLYPIPVMPAQMQSAGYRVEASVLSGGGGLGASSSFLLNASVGQSTAIGVSQSALHQMRAGFWYQLLKMITGGDVNGDGAVDLRDAIQALQILAKASGVDGDKAADISGDGAIGAQEVIYVLQKVGLLR